MKPAAAPAEQTHFQLLSDQFCLAQCNSPLTTEALIRAVWGFIVLDIFSAFRVSQEGSGHMSATSENASSRVLNLKQAESWLFPRPVAESSFVYFQSSSHSSATEMFSFTVCWLFRIMQSRVHKQTACYGDRAVSGWALVHQLHPDREASSFTETYRVEVLTWTMMPLEVYRN